MICCNFLNVCCKTEINLSKNMKKNKYLNSWSFSFLFQNFPYNLLVISSFIRDNFINKWHGVFNFLSINITIFPGQYKYKIMQISLRYLLHNWFYLHLLMAYFLFNFRNINVFFRRKVSNRLFKWARFRFSVLSNAFGNDTQWFGVEAIGLVKLN